MMVHGNNSVYICDQEQQGVLHKIRTGDSIFVTDEESTLTTGTLIRGTDSNALSQISKIIRILNPTEDPNEKERLQLVLSGTVGEFIDGETVFDVTDSSTTAKVEGSLVRGSTNLDSDSRVLRLPIGYKPIASESIDTDIGIIAVKGSGNINQTPANLFVWDSFDTSFYRRVKLPYPLVTAIHTHNGVPYIWGGDNEGYSLGYYSSSRIEHQFYIDNGLPPLQGAVDADQNRIVWGSKQTYPVNRSCVWAWGSKAQITRGLHNIISLENNEQVSALKMYDLKSNPLVSDGTGVHFKGTTNYDSIFKTEVLDFGQPFTINEIIIGLSRELLEGEEVDVILRYDNDSTQDTHQVRYGDYNDRLIRIHPTQSGVQNLIIEIQIRCNVSVILPIKINYTIHD